MNGYCLKAFGLGLMIGGATVLQSFAAGPMTLISIDTTWRFLADSSDQGTAWKDLGFDDSGWASGQALLGFETTPAEYLPYTLRTFIPAPLNNGPITIYYRTHFNLDGSPIGINLIATNLLDDGAVFYLNGVEIDRIRVPADQNNATLAVNQGVEGVPERRVWEETIVAANLVQGDNLLAVELHQSGTASSDDVFGMTLTGVTSSTPVITDQTSIRDQLVGQCESVSLTLVAVSAPDPTYQWFHDGSPIVDATNATYTIPSMQSGDVGAYFARASNPVGHVDSKTANLTYLSDTVAPSIRYAVGNSVDLTKITVIFSENLDPSGTLLDPFNWSVDDTVGGTLTVVQVEATNNIVTLTTDARTSDTAYNATVQSVADLCAGNASLSLTVGVAVFETPLLDLTTQQWKYLDTGADLGTAWSAVGFDDSSWPTGTGLFDGKRGAPTDPLCRTTIAAQTINTCIALSNVFGADLVEITNVYFRTHFSYSGGSTVLLRGNQYIDDGVIYFLNGVELTRVGLPAGQITANTFAARTIGDAALEMFDLVATNLVSGDNVLAAEVNQAANTSSDITFGLGLVSVVSGTSPKITSITFDNGLVTINWLPVTGTLVSADAVNGPYSPVLGAAGGSFAISALGTQKFFQVQMP